MQLLTKGDDFVAGLKTIASGIVALEAELKKVWAKKDDEIEKLKASLVSLTGQDAELVKMKDALAGKDAEIAQMARKCIHFKAQVASTAMSK